MDAEISDRNFCIGPYWAKFGDKKQQK